MKITATIITFNEERNIARAIESLRCCDEILIVDSGSVDRTMELAEKLGARVIEAGWHEGYGQLIEIRHKNGESTRYGHLSKIYVHPGQMVQANKTLIGRVGSTGLSTGPHLHFEIRDKNGKAVNPMASIGHANAVMAARKPKK